MLYFRTEKGVLKEKYRGNHIQRYDGSVNVNLRNDAPIISLATAVRELW